MMLGTEAIILIAGMDDEDVKALMPADATLALVRGWRLNDTENFWALVQERGYPGGMRHRKDESRPEAYKWLPQHTRVALFFGEDFCSTQEAAKALNISRRGISVLLGRFRRGGTHKVLRRNIKGMGLQFRIVHPGSEPPTVGE